MGKGAAAHSNLGRSWANQLLRPQQAEGFTGLNPVVGPTGGLLHLLNVCVYREAGQFIWTAPFPFIYSILLTILLLYGIIFFVKQSAYSHVKRALSHAHSLTNIMIYGIILFEVT